MSLLLMISLNSTRRGKSAKREGAGKKRGRKAGNSISDRISCHFFSLCVGFREASLSNCVRPKLQEKRWSVGFWRPPSRVCACVRRLEIRRLYNLPRVSRSLPHHLEMLSRETHTHTRSQFHLSPLCKRMGMMSSVLMPRPEKYMQSF